MTKILVEGLRHLDMEGMINPILGVDQYASSVGTDDDLITLDFEVKSKDVAEDLSEWFEKGYDFVIDSSPSPGEVTNGKFLVFVEVERRRQSPNQIMEMLGDLETLTGLSTDDWKMKIGDDVEPASIDFIKRNVKTSPHDYRLSKEEKTDEDNLNEWREIAGIKTVNTYKDDEDMKALKRQAGIY